ncbi:hypothetical protein ZHAS_00006398 [Anopheles sinensis]|uniref:Uncharacterized protein n=1 Tax=Anopheles sinensis TaxID=74873 RepID=A0A084VM80_ANOSI|nr:hypothetical protein ZHAS_00006398 [Anopheles sinensis]
MRLLAVLYLVFLVQATLAHEGGASNGRDEEPSGDGGPALTRRKRGWGWSSSPSNRATKKPIGWSFSETPKKPKRRPLVLAPPPPPPGPAPSAPVYYVPVTGPVYNVPAPTFTFQTPRPTKSLTRELVKGALVVGTVGALHAVYSKPVKKKTAAERAAERALREQRRHLRKNRSTTVAPATNETTTAIPLAQSELIPVMVQDANKLFQVVYVPRDKIPPGGIPIATSPSFPTGPGSGVPQVAPPFGTAPIPTVVNASAPALNTTAAST